MGQRGGGDKKKGKTKSMRGEKELGVGKRKESNSGWPWADLSWPAIRRTSGP